MFTCLEALLAKREGVRLIVVGMTELFNVTQLLRIIASSALDFYRVDDLRHHSTFAAQLAVHICGRLRQSGLPYGVHND